MAHVSVVGGGVAGLAAAGHAAQSGHSVSLYESGSYADDQPRRGAWGEVVSDTTRLPTVDAATGVVREFEQIAVTVRDGSGLEQVAAMHGPALAVIDRGRVECAWRRALPAAVDVYTDHHVSSTEFRRLCRESALVVDASGPMPVSTAVTALTVPPSPAVKTLSTQSTGAFEPYFPVPAAVVGPQVKAFITTKSPQRATYGIGFECGRGPADGYAAFVGLCEAAGLPVPDRDTVHIGLEPTLSSRPPENCVTVIDEARVHLAGDAAGLVSGMNQFGICRAIDSAVAAVASWDQSVSYTDWLRRATRRRRLQTRLLKPLERRVGSRRFAAMLGRLPIGIRLSWL
ncbi:MAG: Dehydrogenases (flavoprotein) [halophilic archaeon J07HX5]|jgi:Dehydrogenases (flavoproteins)|nr:MAG: Dehydrogenases (flavoprotein) [halophilic archaeon J07HX5]